MLTRPNECARYVGGVDRPGTSILVCLFLPLSLSLLAAGYLSLAWLDWTENWAGSYAVY